MNSGRAELVSHTGAFPVHTWQQLGLLFLALNQLVYPLNITTNVKLAFAAIVIHVTYFTKHFAL